MGVHIHELHRRSAGGGYAVDSGVPKHEMVEPLLSAWVKQLDDSACRWIDAGEIRPLATVASAARPGKILNIVSAAMLLRHDVFQMERRMGISGFG